MEVGIDVDFGHAASTQRVWAPGEFEANFFGNVKGKQLDRALKVDTYRCPRCGLLDSYAIDPR
jgi:hypothetical protein